jgi:hypothetical protein
MFADQLQIELSRTGDLHIRHQTVEGFEYEFQGSGDMVGWHGISSRFLGDNAPHTHVVTPNDQERMNYRVSVTPYP